MCQIKVLYSLGHLQLSEIKFFEKNTSYNTNINTDTLKALKCQCCNIILLTWAQTAHFGAIIWKVCKCSAFGY